MTYSDGTKRYHFTHITPLRGKNGKIVGIVGNSVDVTEQKMLENRLKELNQNLQSEVEKQVEELRKRHLVIQQQSKLAAMGEMIGAIAHQWRQPLNALSVNIGLLDEDFEEGEVDGEYVERFIEKSDSIIQHMSRTIDDFRNFFRVDKIKEEFDVKKAVEETLTLQQAQLNRHNIEVSIKGGGFLTNGFKGEFKQVILNIINNTKDAFLEKEIELPKLTMVIEKKSVIIEDNAGGIADEVIDRIFEPYFTTKEEGKGTGMGLYVSKMIIEENMGGVIEAHNTKEGVRFIISCKET